MRRIVGAIVAVAMVHGPCPSGQAALPRAVKSGKPEKSDEAKQAQALYNEGKYLEAAQAFEALAPKDAKYAYYAGLAYEAHGFDAQAILLWRGIVGGDEVEAGLRAKAESRLEAAKGRTSELRAAVSPEAAAGPARLYYVDGGERPPLAVSVTTLREGVFLDPGTWRIEVDSARADFERGAATIVLEVKRAEAAIEVVLRPVERSVTLNLAPARAYKAGLKVTLTDPDGLAKTTSFVAHRKVHPLRLRQGRWTYVVEASGHGPARGEIVVTEDGAQEFSVTLAPIQRERSELRPLAIGTGVAGALLAVGGGVGVAVSRRAFVDPVTDQWGTYYPVPRDADDPTRTAIDPLDSLDASRGLLGASAGFLVTSLTAVSRQPRVRKRAWAAEGALGAVLAGAGAGLYAVALDGLHPARVDAKIHGRLDKSGVDDSKAMTIPATLMLGAGAALVVGAATGLILERRHARNRKGYAKGPRLRSLAPVIVSF